MNERTPSVRALRRMAPMLGVSVHWLETGEEDPAELLARLVLDHVGDPPALDAMGLALAVLRDRERPYPRVRGYPHQRVGVDPFAA